ncbi:MAG: tRNA pseudouridine(55) synthase TruB [Bacteroidales bacterium]|jgi:tRNA pseudouridine55 synthase|nr:tRNA pseudouridine(55) synthase TruB [Bacteroidales bacterium]MDD3300595.1 tRNA pseudouridine(55) synthase TruB [Bacteroidales bacterium]MDD3843351.1 tRNA pseudouridine(55) synthase TruB [Bacteroidales bacterium]MDD4617624.1 tRNA pseudouridine(55) synthase TruB [Bacteroidales bacterium]
MEYKMIKGATIIDKTALSVKLSRNFQDYPGGLVFVVDKPYGWTSADAVRKLKFSLQRWFGIKNIKVGHAGTLDPLATGILLICAGKATKIAETLQSQQKEYIAEITFGATTPSYDLEKEIDNTYPFEHITLEGIKNIIPTFLGEQQQLPPIFSAKLIDGKRAYESARAGEQVKMKPATVTINTMEIAEWSQPILTIAISCSKGTYVRSLARDMGVALNSGAHLTGLVRSGSGQFKIAQAISFENLKPFFDLSV